VSSNPTGLLTLERFDGMVDLHWVQALTVPLHLGIIDRPFVPHNLTSAQESLVPLPKFQMAPRLKILMSSGSMKGTQIYYPFLSRKSGQADSLQVTKQGPSGERYSLTWHFYVSLSKRLYGKSVPPCPAKAGSLWK
jgi:hypothetical protein